MDSSSNESRDDRNAQGQAPAGGEHEHSGSSGEGAASVLAQLKKEQRQHGRPLGDNEGERSSGESQ